MNKVYLVFEDYGSWDNHCYRLKSIFDNKELAEAFKNKYEADKKTLKETPAPFVEHMINVYASSPQEEGDYFYDFELDEEFKKTLTENQLAEHYRWHSNTREALEFNNCVIEEWDVTKS
jgi:hypothetical protein